MDIENGFVGNLRNRYEAGILLCCSSSVGMESFSWIVVIGMVVLAVEGTVPVLVGGIVLLLGLAVLIWNTVPAVCCILW